MIAENSKRYLKLSLAGTPTIIRALINAGNAVDFDRVVDPNRFTLREMLAHLGDWETINLGRLIQFRDDVDAVIQGIDEGQWAIDHEHNKADPFESLSNFTIGRQKIVEFIGTLTDDDWKKTGFHTEAGHITLAEYLIFINVHDGYHLLQTVEWVGL